MTAAAIEVDGLSKLYARYAHRRRFATLKSALLRGGLWRDLRPEGTFRALSDVSFHIGRGASVAVIGPNGSGKSTLLKVLAGILKPTSGRVEVRGRVAALLELGAGFHPEVSGRENVIINGIMLGLGRREIEHKLDAIAAFAEIGDFLDAPVKTYSSGMYVRLAFSVAVAVEPDVLLVDEVLAVGDEAFSHKCMDRFQDLKRRGRTVLLVTHSLDLAEQLVDEVILLEDGRVTATGLPREVIDRYRGHVDDREQAALNAANVARRAEEVAVAAPPVPAASAPASWTAGTAAGSDGGAVQDAGGGDLPDSWRPRRWGNRLVELRSVELRGQDGEPRALFRTGDGLCLELEVVAHEPQEDFDFGVAIFARNGQLAYGTSTQIEGFRPRRLAGAGRVRIDITRLLLLDGSYSLDVAACRLDGTPFDYRHACLTFAVRSDTHDLGVARLEHGWEFSGGIAIDPRG